MLRKVLVAAGIVLLLVAVVFVAIGFYPLLPHLLILGLMLSAGIVWERWQYKKLQTGKPGPAWKPTGERFVDPQSGKTIEVYVDPGSGESRYVEAEP